MTGVEPIVRRIEAAVPKNPAAIADTFRIIANKSLAS